MRNYFGNCEAVFLLHLLYMNLSQNPGKIQLWVTVAGMAAAAAAAAFVMLHFSGFIYKFHATSLFQESASWFAEHFERPAALLIYCGRFLTQFCYYPAVAVTLLLLLYAAITVMTYRLFLRGGRIPFLAIIPALALYTALMRIGYGVIVFRADALIFTEPLGILSALLLFRLTVLLSPKIRWAIPFLAYPLVGCYALLALLIHAAFSISREKGAARLASVATDLACLAVVPWIEYLLLYNHSVLRYMWLQGAPFLDYIYNPKEWIPLAVAAATPVLLALMPERKSRPAAVWHPLLTLALTAAAVTCIYLLPYRDSLFHRQMAAERAIDNDDWDKVAERLLPLRVTNEVLIAYRNCALYAKGRLEEGCMNYSFNTVPIVMGDQEYSSSLIAGPTIFFHSGLLNYASRISSEISLYTNYSVERWKYLAKAAVFNGERDLAEKYLGTLSRTTLHKGWARHWRSLFDDPERLAQDPQYKRLHPLQDYDETRWMPSDNAAANVILFYRYVPGRSPEMQQWNRAAEKMSSF